MSMSPINCLTSAFQHGGDQQMRNYLTALMITIGTPMIMMGALTLALESSLRTSCATIHWIHQCFRHLGRPFRAASSVTSYSRRAST
jgi:hypothetical protein